METPQVIECCLCNGNHGQVLDPQNHVVRFGRHSLYFCPECWVLCRAFTRSLGGIVQLLRGKADSTALLDRRVG